MYVCMYITKYVSFLHHVYRVEYHDVYRYIFHDEGVRVRRKQVYLPSRLRCVCPCEPV